MMRTKGWNTVWQRIVFITFILDESRGSEEHDEARRAGGHRVLALVTVHPGAVRPGLASGEHGDPAGEERSTERRGHEGNNDVLL